MGLGFIRALRPVSYNWKEGGATRYGFLAQQVVEAARASGALVAPGVQYDAASDRYGLNYAELIGPTVKAVQEVDKQMQELNRGQQDINAQVVGQESRLEALEAENNLLKAELCRKDRTYSFCG